MRTRGVAGNVEPDGEGIFLCESPGQIRWFTRMAFDSGVLQLDVWQVTLDIEVTQQHGDPPHPIVRTPEGYLLWPLPIAPEQLQLVTTHASPDSD